MVKTISFSVTKILKALLDKSKTQTIRRAYKTQEEILKKGKLKEGYLIPEDDRYESIADFDKGVMYHYIKKPPRFKVGDKVKLYWKQRSKYKWFRKKTGEHIHDFADIDRRKHFEKILGEAEITEVFEITMWKQERTEFFKDCIGGKGKPLTKYGITYVGLRMEANTETIAELDGFDSAEEMFKFFDEFYGLDEPKKFYVYRWKWRSHK